MYTIFYLLKGDYTLINIPKEALGFRVVYAHNLNLMVVRGGEEEHHRGY